MNGVETASGEESDLVPLMAPGDKVVIRVVEGETSKVYTLTATINAPVISAVDAIAGSQFDNQTPMYIIDDSGMTGKGLSAVHDNNSNAFTMWHTNANPGASAWVQIDLGQSYALDEMWVWNMNQQNNIGRGLKNVKIEYSADGVKWQNLEPEEGMSFTDSPEGYPFQLAQGTGQNGMAATNLTDGKPVELNLETRYIRITADPENGQGNYGSDYYGLSEVRFTKQMTTEGMLDEAEAAAKNALAGMTVSNETTDDEILSAVQSAVGESVQVSWAEDFQMTPATYAEAGSITGSLELALNGENRTVDVGLVIPVILIKGDVTGDGRVAIEDVMAACRILARKNTNIDPDDDEIARGDVTKDGEITIEDIMAICRILAQQSV